MHSVIPTDTRIMPISEDEGTGLVHTAVSAGTEDYKLGQKLGLPMIPVINDRAEYLDGLDFLTGKNAKKHPEIILDIMEKEGFMYKTEQYKHRYPACWRCKTELVWKVTDEWYIAMDKEAKGDSKDIKQSKSLRERMKDAAGEINWIPAFGKERELDWLNNMHDWLISKKNRYWGLALPIWECDKCGNFDVIGSKDELEKRVVEGWDEFEGKSPHKPQIDKVKVKCSQCSEMSNRIEPVGNPWLDAGIVPFSTISEHNKAATLEDKEEPLYFEDKEKWRNWFPTDFITESFPGQFKNWFYSLIAMSCVLENEKPFKTVLGYATLLAEDGRPMHKSWGNSIEFNEGASKIGVDVMRWMYARQNPSDNMLFGYKIADEVRRRFHLKLWNIFNYFIVYANIDRWTPNGKENSNANTKNILDRWIISRFNETYMQFNESIENYDVYTATASIEKFVDDMSNWYVRRSRERTGSTSESSEDKAGFYKTMYFVLTELMKIVSPIIPYISDRIFTNLTKKESVHLEEWPAIEGEIDKNLITEMENVRLVAEKAHAERKGINVPVRQPLNTLFVKAPFEVSDKNLIKLILDEVNVKEVEFKKASELEVEYDTKITPELEEEAKARELIRTIQQKRKEIGVALDEEVRVKAPWLPQDKKSLEKVRKTTLAKFLKLGELEVEKL